jgi:prepilin-type N-terminal cleavage/methylation domain-containing protein
MKSALVNSLLAPVSAPPSRSSAPGKRGGYTMVEVMIVVVIVGLLSAIMAPSYLSWRNNQQVGAVRSRMSDAMRKAQNEAKRTKTNRELRFDSSTGQIRYAIVPTQDTATVPNRLANDQIRAWQSLSPTGGSPRDLRLRTSASPLPGGGANGGATGGIVFDPYGNVVSANPASNLNANVAARNNIFTVQVSIGDDTYKRCITVQTLLGSFREEKDNTCPPVL